MFKQNLDTTDRVLRFALGFWWLSQFAPHFSADWGNFLIALIGWIALLESFYGWCGINAMLGINNKK